jgi:hypothetical protein
MKYKYDLQYIHFNPATGVHTEVCIDTEANYGFFERIRMGLLYDEHMSEGGLWLGPHKYHGTELLDYDGVYELPKDVAFLLQYAGVHVDSDFTEY